MVEKKAWTKPMLISLVRSEPASAVLSFCKTPAGATGTPSNVAVGCKDYDIFNGEVYCYPCEALESS